MTADRRILPIFNLFKNWN
ncbi:unnamed protein product, partial [Rotaria sp. Silwood1]